MSLKYFGLSVQGKKSPENEDSFLLPVQNDVYKIDPDTKNRGHIFLLCDGMGGYHAGEVASKLCCGWFFKEYYEAEDNINNIQKWLKEEIDSLNNRLFQLSEQYKEYSGMGTTLVNMLIKDNQSYFNNVGDSRLYLFRDNSLKQLTEDDSEVWKLYKAGMISKDEILNNTRKHVITRAMATKSFVEVHEYKVLEIYSGDLFLLCSDGLTDFVTDTEISEILKRDTDIEVKIKLLVEKARVNGTNDDTTVIGILVG